MSSRPIYLLATAVLPGDLAAEAASAGMTLDVLSFIGIEFVEVDAVIPEVAVFTSVHAVTAVKRWLSGPSPNLRIYCIGGATYRAVAEAFGERTAVGTAGSAGELAELIRDREAGPREEIIFFCGDQRREELPSIGVTVKTVYRTVLTPWKLERVYDGIAFFSPSAVESFFSVNRIGARVPLFAIGKTTEASLHARCSNPVFVASEPDRAVLIHKMIDFFLFEP
ncbi:MAG TPA: uroporphyrinogen-III synthase [Puia sp.]|nr:uroporphyrinogen-III synthase [Puia sp.]